MYMVVATNTSWIGDLVGRAFSKASWNLERLRVTIGIINMELRSIGLLLSVHDYGSNGFGVWVDFGRDEPAEAHS